jgi:hypothetical protein
VYGADGRKRKGGRRRRPASRPLSSLRVRDATRTRAGGLQAVCEGARGRCLVPRRDEARCLMTSGRAPAVVPAAAWSEIGRGPSKSVLRVVSEQPQCGQQKLLLQCGGRWLSGTEARVAASGALGRGLAVALRAARLGRRRSSCNVPVGIGPLGRRSPLDGSRLGRAKEGQLPSLPFWRWVWCVSLSASRAGEMGAQRPTASVGVRASEKKPAGLHAWMFKRDLAPRASGRALSVRQAKSWSGAAHRARVPPCCVSYAFPELAVADSPRAGSESAWWKGQSTTLHGVAAEPRPTPDEDTGRQDDSQAKLYSRLLLPDQQQRAQRDNDDDDGV